MKKEKLAFEKENYIIMLIGLAVLLVGFLIMNSEQAEYGFGFKALTLSPIVILAGFGIQFYAIFYKKKNASNESSDEISESNSKINLKK
jgi:hypothetical protein